MEQIGIQKGIETMQEQYDKASFEYEKLSARQSDLDRSMRQYRIYEKNIEDLMKQKEHYDSRINSITASLDNPDRVRVDHPSRASVPLQRSFPRWSVFGPAGLVLGLYVPSFSR